MGNEMSLAKERTTIREYAESCGFNITGRLHRMKFNCPEELKMFYRGDIWYIDEAENEYLIRDGNVCIVTAEGGVI